MPNAKVVFLTGLPQRTVDVILSHNPDGFETQVVRRDASVDEQKQAVADADFIIVYGAELADDVLRAGPKVRVVQTLAAGYDRMNHGLMADLDVACCNNGGANSWAVADHTVLLMLAVYRKLIAVDLSTREGRWNEPITGANTFEMAEKMVGVLGIGNIGRQVAKRVQGFDSKTQYYDLYPLPEETERELNLSRVELDELFATSDVVTCHIPLTPQTRHVVSRERIAMMKPTSIVVNTSRGPVVDEAALIDALREGQIAGAGLDVFEQEPVDPNNPLLKMENVIATPHTAGTTWDTWPRRAGFAYRNLKGVWEGEPPMGVARDFDIQG
ncbi:MAG: 2-hydroxyacid dehydrogenase [SAR202 cluster bacterium]|jgi:phosphoglycerate dehydrogenase-like enzyme|nr:2-hydroxyacid dehydrogenase [SAR202 cluster bacterium]MDP7104308.1 2-hydroxyacid dehydrogenase [SAR202 cluster bacterium]MDP7225904.1 2-hydroxyacid dehydrogenase [SAR202 cluster bacterium]HJO80814.1 2-hydroxyacid dehydrogenase [SAR202 cluster bacterium]|tara:strand:- start:386 stop:1369 length:984 start_codon:yes stop_codon:yes gene_type:complete